MSASNIQNAAAAAAAQRGIDPSDSDSESDMEYVYEYMEEDEDDEDDDDQEGGDDEDEEMSDEAQREAAEEFLQLAVDHTPLTRIVTSAQLRELLAHLHSDEPYRSIRYGQGGQSREPEYPFLPRFDHPVPDPEGVKLMNSGAFGTNPMKGEDRSAERKRTQFFAKRILTRELGTFTGERARLYNQLIAQDLMPSTKADFIIHSDHRSYSGQFSHDGNLFYTCTQDFYVRIYDTSNPYEWRFIKAVQYFDGQWTLTDADLSPDSKYIAYSSITSDVCLSSTAKDGEDTQILDFGAERRRNPHAMRYGGIWSIRFSGDGRELVAGCNDNHIYVYDIEQRRPILKLGGHSNDVNAVCYADKQSPHILFSGSDDTTVKVWDRRSMADGREVGVFPGHTEGITYVDSKGDGRYVLSNGKDQTMKLWDIRNMMDAGEYKALPRKDYTTGFDYRSEYYDARPHKIPHDKSLVTYTGHEVLNTLIRCHFSPPTSTGSRYVYSGSSNGKVAIYNLDATRAGTVDVHEASKNNKYREMSGSRGYGEWPRRVKACVRDVSWHPHAPILAATSWSGGYGKGMVTVHMWNGDGPMKKVDVDEGTAKDDVTRNFTVEMRKMNERTQEVASRYTSRRNF